MDLSYLAEGFLWLLCTASAVYCILRLFFYGSIVSFTDPLNLALLLLAFYFSGALFLPTVTSVNQSYYNVLILNFVFVIVASFFARTPRPAEPLSLKGKPTHHLMFACFFTGLLLLNLVANQIFGIIPLFAGTQTRGELGDSAIPTLVLLAPDIGTVLLLIFLLTNTRMVKWISGFGLAIASISAILNGSKSAVITTTVLALFSADYVFHVNRRAIQPSGERERTDKRIHRLRKWIVATSILVALMLPAYLVFIGADSGGGSSTAVELFTTRLFGGFDNLAFIAFKDLDISSVSDVSLLQFYFYPFFKKFAFTPTFQSAGEYIVYMSSNNYDSASAGLNPNSNFAIELLLQYGNVAISGFLIVLVAAILFIARRAILTRTSLSMLMVIFWTAVVMAPFTLLFDGALFFIKFYVLLACYFGFNSVVNLYKWLQGNPFHYVFY